MKLLEPPPHNSYFHPIPLDLDAFHEDGHTGMWPVWRSFTDFVNPDMGDETM